MRYVKYLCLVCLLVLASIGTASTYNALKTRCWEVCDNGVWCVTQGCGGGVPVRETEKVSPSVPEATQIDEKVLISSPSPAPAPATIFVAQ